MFEMSDFEMPVLDHMQEPPLVWWTIMRADNENLDIANHRIVDHIQARSEVAAFQEASYYQTPGVYYVVRKIEGDFDVRVVRSQ